MSLLGDILSVLATVAKQNKYSGASYSFGATLLMLSGIAEFLLGNTFPSVVFLAYGSHFLTMAITYTPFFAAISSYNADGSQEQSPAFLATFGKTPTMPNPLGLLS